MTLKHTIACFAIFSVTLAFSQNQKYSFSINNVTTAFDGKVHLSEFIAPYINRTPGNMIRFSFNDETDTFFIETAQGISLEDFKLFIKEKTGNDLINFRVAE